MKSFTVIASSLLLCSCADMVVTKTYVSNSATRTEVDAKDFGSASSVRYSTNCGVGEANPSAIYIRPFCIDRAVIAGDIATSDGEVPIRKSLIPVEFAERFEGNAGRCGPDKGPAGG